MSQSPLDLARQPTPEDDSEQLARDLKDISLRGRNSEQLIGDVRGARMVHNLFRKHPKFKGAAEFEEDLLPLVSRKMKEYADVDPQTAAVFMNIGLKATHQNAQAEERLMKLAGLGHKEDGAATTVNINNTYADKVLNIIDPVRGSHGRTAEEQVTLNDAARKLLGFGSNLAVKAIGVGPPADVAQDSGRRQMLDAATPDVVERNPGSNDGQAEPSADHQLPPAPRKI